MGLLRLFLAAVVAIGHFRTHILNAIDTQAAPVLNYLQLGFDAGHAVIFFYVISGFLISYAIDNKYRDNLTSFYQSRFIRIFPLYWALYAALIIFDYGESRPQIVGANIADWLPGFTLFGSDWAICFLRYPDEYWPVFPPFLRPAWSLGAEVTFYAMAPLLLYRFPKLCLAALIGSIMVRGTMVYQYGYNNTWTLHFFPSTLMFFLLGHYARLIYRWVGPRFASYNYLWLIPFFGLHLYNVTTWQPFDGPFFYAELVALLLALPSLFEKTKDSRILNFLGDLSYPLYVSHLTTLALLEFIPPLAPAIHGTGKPTLLLGLPVETRFIVYALLFITCCIAVSALLHKCVDVPLSSLFRCVFRWRPWVAAPVPSA